MTVDSLTLAVGLIGFHALEGWSVFDCLYFCVISTLTRGYGESRLTPDNTRARLFCTFYVGISVLLVSASIGNIVSIRAETVLAEEVKRRLHLELDVDLILELGHGKAGVNKYEFVAGILDQLGYVTSS